jgi:putative exporter of polyketide antibiotics
VADVPQQVGFYERMLPERERPIEALGGLLNGMGAGLGIMALIWWPLLLGATGIGFGIISLVFARDRDVQSRFAIGFTIAALGWLFGMMIAVSGHSPLSP